MSEETYETEDWVELKNAIEYIEDSGDVEEDIIDSLRKAKKFIEAQLDIREGIMYMKSGLTSMYYKVYSWVERGNGLYEAIQRRDITEEQYKQGLYDEYCESWSKDTGESEESMPMEPEEVFKHHEEKWKMLL
jgi:hypothetical protein